LSITKFLPPTRIHTSPPPQDVFDVDGSGTISFSEYALFHTLLNKSDAEFDIAFLRASFVCVRASLAASRASPLCSL
jgi:hypothetical protein